MNGYSYRLYQHPEDRITEPGVVRYSRDELTDMTTYQLRVICSKEKLIEGLVNTLDRDGLIGTILKFRGSEERLMIGSPVPGGEDRVQTALRRYLRTPLGDRGTKVPARITLYEGLCLDERDGYRLEGAASFEGTNVLLVNEQMELCGILGVVKDAVRPGTYYLTRDRHAYLRRTSNRKYSLLFFSPQDSDYLYRIYHQNKPLPPVNLHYCRIPAADLEIREPEHTEAVLAVDFGTSNTTAGVYLDAGYIQTPCSQDLLHGNVRLDAINYVAFPDPADPQGEWIELLPTVVRVADCSDPSDIRYQFGHEALLYRKKLGSGTQATVFHGIKRWVNDYVRSEEVTDANGNSAHVSRSEIIRAYLTYIIRTAEHQFKCQFRNLHMTSPVKLKAQFQDMFAEILPAYKLETENALDEGMAVLYNTIADRLEQNRFEDGETYKALVIDCGGGTTDLSSCRFRIEDGHMAYRLDVQTTYENGDTNFGGNNLTHRIMQYMKIVFAEYYSCGQSVTGMDSLIGISSGDVFRYVDEYGIGSLYERLEARYREAELLIPTRYREYGNHTREDYNRVRNNYHFLWEMAESMKTEFFRKTGVLRNRFHAGNGDVREHDLKITGVDKWYLSIREQGGFKDRYEFPDAVFTIQEINHLIKADIYEIVRKFLEDFYQSGELQTYSIIKLTGQSCRIDVFREALKEFVPGRTIQFTQKVDENEKVPDLKLACLKGAIRYLRDKKAGVIETNMTHQSAVIPYSVTAYTHSRIERILISTLDRDNAAQGCISRPWGAAEIEFYLKDMNGKLRQRYIYPSRPAGFKPVLYEDIMATYGGKIPQDDTDSIVNEEVKFFVFGGGQNWGFHVVPVARRKEQLYLGAKRFFAFENDLSEIDFFDGLK
ncbi:molecular chaperone [Paenibacillus sp. FJAT-26967]|uniref:molecular chaperone n=1 Tax=Paenibacillus sp. FJAT-26967 TaxID=1729690 RepID=UPI000838F17C|nr:molecular chaperone [Paenibacillus sp. FJAT-26967]